MKIRIEAEDHELEEFIELIEGWIERVEKIIEKKEAEDETKTD
tara:strand:+ start:769 stop:897 length:129 start_codon:yes stop_codon:yes gene_type:complete